MSLHEFTICGRYFDIKTGKKQVRATMGLRGWGSDHLMTWWSYMFHESSIFREISWIFRRSLWGWKLIWPKAATCGHLRPLAWKHMERPLRATCSHSLAIFWSGHLRPLAWNWLERPLAATRGHLRPLAATCGHSSGCKWLQVAANGRRWLLEWVAASGCKWLRAGRNRR